MVSLVSLEYVSGLESELKPRNAESGKIRYVSVFMSGKLSVLKLITDTCLAIYCCEILSKLFKRPVSQFPHLPGGDNCNTSPLDGGGS